MLPSDKGLRTELAVMTALAELGKQVLLPFGPCRFDVAYEEDDRLVKVQCKTGTLKKGAVVFLTCSNGRHERRDYRGEVDYFGVYCRERGEVYLVPVDDVPLRLANLRVEPARNGQAVGVRLASKYLIWSAT